MFDVKAVLTGTPGTGKTTVSERMSEEGFNIVHLTRFLKREGLGEEKEEREVEIPEMVKALKQKDFQGKTLIEGHLSHHFSADVCIVLRCRPEKLEERLSERDYSEEKVKENMEAEALDLILSEAVDIQEKVVEVDTTGKTVEETVEEIKSLVEEGEESYGKVDWTDFL